MRVATALRIVSVVVAAKALLIGVVYWRRAEILGRPVHIGAGSWACLMARKPESSPNSPAPNSPPSRPSHPTSTHSSGDSDPSSSRLHPRCSTCTAAPPEQPPASWGKPQTSHDSAANPPLSATRDWPRCRTGQAVHMAGCAHTKEATDASTAPCIRRPWCASKLAARGPTNTAGAANPILHPRVMRRLNASWHGRCISAYATATPDTRSRRPSPTSSCAANVVATFPHGRPQHTAARDPAPPTAKPTGGRDRCGVCGADRPQPRLVDRPRTRALTSQHRWRSVERPTLWG